MLLKFAPQTTKIFKKVGRHREAPVCGTRQLLGRLKILILDFLNKKIFFEKIRVYIVAFRIYTYICISKLKNVL